MKPLFALLPLILLFTPLLAQDEKPSPDFDYRTKFKTTQELEKETDKSKKILGLITGHYSNKAQAQALDNPLYQAQEMFIVPVWEERSQTEHWFYIGWFASGRLEQSLAQGLVRVQAHNKDSFSLRSYLFKENYPLEWQKQNAFADLTPDDLEVGKGCTAYLYENQTGQVVWKANDFCHQPLSDLLEFHRVHLVFSLQGVEAFSQYYTDKQTLLFGYPEDLPNTFERLKTKRPSQYQASANN